MSSDERPIIVFDSICPLCSAQVQFILSHDRQRRYRLAPMQGAAGMALYRRFGIDPADPDTFLLVEDGKAMRDSDAVIAILRGLGGPWRAAGMARIVPRALRNRLYRWVARNRYRLFGRRSTCWVPSAEDRDRLL